MSTSLAILIKPISFGEILPLWEKQLWPGRKSVIEPVSAMKLGGGIDMQIMKSTPQFFGAFYDQKLVGAISGFETEERVFRLRGLIIDSEFRGSGIGARLVSAIIQFGLEHKFCLFWTAPRKNNFDFYRKNGFVAITDWTNVLFEMGPNCYATRQFTERQAFDFVNGIEI